MQDFGEAEGNTERDATLTEVVSIENGSGAHVSGGGAVADVYESEIGVDASVGMDGIGIGVGAADVVSGHGTENSINPETGVVEILSEKTASLMGVFIVHAWAIHTMNELTDLRYIIGGIILGATSGPLYLFLTILPKLRKSAKWRMVSNNSLNRLFC